MKRNRKLFGFRCEILFTENALNLKKNEENFMFKFVIFFV